MGLRRASRANSSASANAPIVPMTQPSTVRLPTRGERGRQQEDSRADHVAGDDYRGEDRSELAMAGH